jgi:demethylmenaquinone methyltransferase / 2-methoxy-6-polyprenyl-1,4-benzoquinol methylase
MTVKPYNTEKSKKEEVAAMFDNISHRYDFLNHFLSAGIDIKWRKKAIRLLKAHRPKSILDIATGTADFALESMSLKPEMVKGIDISEGMLSKGREKISARNLQSVIELRYGDSEQIPFDDASFDAAIVAFGVRNFENLPKGLSEICRVLRKDGVAMILEFSRPRKFPVKQLYGFYFKHILPRLGKAVSSDAAAYNYLPESVNAFPDGSEFAQILTEAGFKKAEIYPQTFGIATIYKAYK